MKKLSINITEQKDRFKFTVFFGSFVFSAFLMWCTPYSSDDLEFGTLGFATIGEYVRFALYYGNGRFMGNLCALALSNSKLLCVLVKAFVLSSAVVLAPVVLDLREKSSYLASFLLITAMSPAVFGEAIIWTSGFGNYLPPIWLTLLIILMIRQYPAAKLPAKILTWLVIPVLGFASQLFIEHSSGVNGLLAFCFLVYHFRNGEKNKAALCGIWLLSTVFGAAAMFLIPKVFYRAGNRVDGYQKTYLSSIPTLINSCVRTGIRLLNYYFGACQIPLCFGAAATVMKTRQQRSVRANRILLGLVAATVMHLGLAMVTALNGYYGKSALVQGLLSAISVMIPLGVWVFSAWKLEPELRRTQLFLLSFAIISIIPLLAVSPTPPRVILQSYVFVILATLHCFHWTGLAHHRQAKPLLIRTCLCLSVLLGSVFLSIRDMAAARDAYIRQEIAQGSKEVAIFVLPYQYTTWDYLEAFSFTYSDDPDLRFDEISFSSWINSHY